MTPGEAFLGRFLSRFPQAGEHLQAALAHPWGEDSVPHDVVADYSLAVKEAVEADEGDAMQRWRDLVDFLEAEHQQDGAVAHLIEEALLLRVPTRQEPEQERRQALGPRLAAAADRMYDVRAHPAHVAFLDDLRRRFPELEADVGENTYGDNDALLAHMFLADVVRRAVALHRSDDQADRDRAQAIVDAVAAAVGQDEEVDNLIAVSFVEDLPDAEHPGADIVRRLPPVLIAWQEALRSDLTPLREVDGPSPR